MTRIIAIGLLVLFAIDFLDDPSLSESWLGWLGILFLATLLWFLDEIENAPSMEDDDERL